MEEEPLVDEQPEGGRTLIWALAGIILIAGVLFLATSYQLPETSVFSAFATGGGAAGDSGVQYWTPNADDTLLLTDYGLYVNNGLLYVARANATIGVLTLEPNRTLDVNGSIGAVELYIGGQTVCLANGTNCPQIDVHNGTDGRNGTDGATGPQGPTGPTGPAGPAGENGSQGPPGSNASVTSGDQYTIVTVGVITSNTSAYDARYAGLNALSGYLPLSGGVINGNLTVIGGILNATVTTISHNGSTLPTLDNQFDLGSATLRYRNVTAARFNGEWNGSTLYLLASATVCYQNGTNCPATSSGNPFDQELNTTNPVIFSTVTSGSLSIEDESDRSMTFSTNEFTIESISEDTRYAFDVATGTVLLGRPSDDYQYLTITNTTFAYLGGNVCTDTNGLCGGGNASWNQTHADTLYYPLNSNPLGYYNISTLPAAAGDGTGGWYNTSTNTNTRTNVSINGTLNTTGDVFVFGGSQVGHSTRYFCDFVNNWVTATSCFPNYHNAIIGTAGASAQVATPSYQRPGVVSISIGTGANSGWYYQTSVTAFVLNGSESFAMGAGNFVLAPGSATTTNQTRMRAGFLDSISNTEPVDGVYFETVANVSSIRGGCVARQNNNRNISATNFTLNTTSWYEFSIKIGQNGTWANCTIYNATSGAVVWTDTVIGIPTTSTMYTGAGVHMYRTVAGTALISMTLDYVNTEIETKRRILV